VALVGLQSLGTGAFFAAANREVSAGPALTLPLFDAGRRRGQLAQSDAAYDAAVEEYNQSLADALREVVDQLTAYRSLGQQSEAQRAGLDTAQQAYDLALLRYREGLGNYLQVLTTHQQLLAQRSLEVQVRARGFDVTIELARALGGGFEPAPADSLAPPATADARRTSTGDGS
jgi:outer membrane protein TolC